MNLNFDPEKLKSSKDKFIWITIKYILNILNILKQKKDENVTLLDILRLNINTLGNYVYIDNNKLYNNHPYELFDVNEYEEYFLKFIKNIPINIDDDEFMC
jgi:hypothetical protein